MFIYIIVNKEIKDTNNISNTNLSPYNSNKSIPNEESKNKTPFENIKETLVLNLINSDENYFLKNEPKSNCLNYNSHYNYINNINCTCNNWEKINNNTYKIIELLKNNPDLNSYIDKYENVLYLQCGLILM